VNDVTTIRKIDKNGENNNSANRKRGIKKNNNGETNG
jgi:hypothetical protein